MSLRPEFPRSLRHLPSRIDTRQQEAANELEGLVQDLSVRLIGSNVPEKSTPSVQRTALIQQLRQHTVWHHRDQVDEPVRQIPEPVTPSQERSSLSQFSTEDLENFVIPPVRTAVLNVLRGVVPSPHHCPIAQDGPAQHEQTVRVAELLAMELAYQRPADAEFIEIPLGEQNALIRYHVEIVPIAMGLQAYGFIPEQQGAGPPVLLFRGTVTSPAHRAAGTTWVADLDPLGVGWAVYQFGAVGIQQWLERATRVAGRKALVTGHSMGGAHATYAGVYNSQYVDKVLTFNPPLVSFLAKAKWIAEKKAGTAPKIWNFINTRDDISHIGQEIVGQDYFIHVSSAAASGEAFRCDRKVFGLFEWSGHTHHSKRMMIHPHVAVAGQRVLSRWRYLFSAIAVIPYLVIYSLLIAKRLLVGHQSASKYSYLLGWVALLLGALATVAIQSAVLAKLMAERIGV